MASPTPADPQPVMPDETGPPSAGDLHADFVLEGRLDSAPFYVRALCRATVREGERKSESGGRRAEDGGAKANAGMSNGAHAAESPSSVLRPPPSGFPSAWLFTVTRNRALDHLRKNRRIIPMTLPDDRPCAAPGPAATLERRESAASLFSLLDALSPNQREVIRLKFQNDLSYREIADVTQLSVTNVGFLLHTGLKKLRALLREQPLPDFDLPLRSAL